MPATTSLERIFAASRHIDDPGRFAGRRVATILCGGNLSPEMRERLMTA
ncbi:MAG: hypothetical protein ACREPQ_20215 [Rhodanobacter sp.]